MNEPNKKRWATIYETMTGASAPAITKLPPAPRQRP